MVTPAKSGCHDSSARSDASHAPPNPRLTNSSGPTQQAVAPKAASTAVTKDVLYPGFVFIIASVQSVPHYGVKAVTENSLTIGQIATEAGVHVETVRYYQRIGLIAEPPRPTGGVRRYDLVVIQRLRFVKRAQELGFSLDEVRQLLTLDDGQSCGETRQLAEHKLAVIEHRLSDLTRMRKTLKSLVAECESGKRPRSCPIIASLFATP